MALLLHGGAVSVSVVGLAESLKQGRCPLAKFDDYRNAYSVVRMERSEGILELTLHTDGQAFQWGAASSEELPRVFRDIAGDPENLVVILTGQGDAFSGPKANPRSWSSKSPTEWDQTIHNELHMSLGLLDISVPMIAAVNGPALRHSELPLLCDIVLAAEHATFMDSAHFAIGAVPGDPVHVVYPLLMGINRARYFLLTGQTLTAQRAFDIGLVNEVLPAKDLLPRARTLAREMARKSPLLLRYSRLLLTHRLKQEIHATLGYGLALAGLVQIEKDKWISD